MTDTSDPIEYAGQIITALEVERDALADENARLHTWAGLISVLDEHYPPDVPLGPDSDPGPRILGLVCELERMRARGEAAKAVVQAWREIRPRVAPASSETGVDLRHALDALARAHEGGGDQ